VKVGYLSTNSISEPSFVTDLNLCACHTYLKFVLVHYFVKTDFVVTWTAATKNRATKYDYIMKGFSL
jgi:hypothetical protein